MPIDANIDNYIAQRVVGRAAVGYFFSASVVAVLQHALANDAL